MPKPKCLNPDCTREAASRGLCRSCYASARTLIRRKLTTWRKLEETGKCAPAERRGPHGKTKRWLLEVPAQVPEVPFVSAFTDAAEEIAQ